MIAVFLSTFVRFARGYHFVTKQHQKSKPPVVSADDANKGNFRIAAAARGTRALQDTLERGILSTVLQQNTYRKIADSKRKRQTTQPNLPRGNLSLHLHTRQPTYLTHITQSQNPPRYQPLRVRVTQHDSIPFALGDVKKRPIKKATKRKT